VLTRRAGSAASPCSVIADLTLPTCLDAARRGKWAEPAGQRPLGM
jgi:hypothetical protein